MTIPSDVASQEFRPRAHEVSRLEAFSDVIFGFAISLLVASLEVPKHYHEFMEVFRGVIPFTLAFLIFIQIWHQHHTFFRRYALQDKVTIALNTFLLFQILVYVYPLKYMMFILTESIVGRVSDIGPPQMRVLFIIYGAGFAAVFFTLAAMNARAWKLRDELELTEFERIDTLEAIYDNLGEGSLGLLSLLIALGGGPLMFCGPVYFLICVPKTIVPMVFGNKRRKLAQQVGAATAA
jgi:uncharacterized membrane protein